MRWPAVQWAGNDGQPVEIPPLPHQGEVQIHRSFRLPLVEQTQELGGPVLP
jgi:hypothetical protein